LSAEDGEAAIRLSYVSANAGVDLQNTMQSSRRLLYGMRRAQRRRLGLAVGGTSILFTLAVLLISSCTENRESDREP
jgi:hypothetical protein